MEIVLALILGAAVGTAAHAALPHRGTRGVAVGPLLGALVAGAVWMVMTWAGLTADNLLLWAAAIAAAAVVTFPALAIVTRVRLSNDRRERAALKIG